MTLDQMEEETQKRRTLMTRMVGTLYPGIVADELLQLHEAMKQRKIAIKTKVQDQFNDVMENPEKWKSAE
jgi:recombinational DNA repair ATPase RecF